MVCGLLSIKSTNLNFQNSRIACQCIAIICGMNEQALNQLLLKTKISEELATKLAIKHKLDFQDSLDTDGTICTTHQDAPLESITYIEDICIPIHNPNKVKPSTVIEVASTKRNLKRIALGLAANKAISLLGPVGSGKTCLVEHLAMKTGRTIGETFVKVQLGDQTDSKMLLGTYRCTDIPGEFIWQPGVLTQVTHTREFYCENRKHTVLYGYREYTEAD